MKQVLVIRKDLGMRKGKCCAQAAHASRYAAADSNPTKVEVWEKIHGQAKIVLGAENLEELLTIAMNCKNAGLVARIVHDAGHTELPPNTITALGIGPDLPDVIDKITGHLKLL